MNLTEHPCSFKSFDLLVCLAGRVCVFYLAGTWLTLASKANGNKRSAVAEPTIEQPRNRPAAREPVFVSFSSSEIEPEQQFGEVETMQSAEKSISSCAGAACQCLLWMVELSHIISRGLSLSLFHTSWCRRVEVDKKQHKQPNYDSNFSCQCCFTVNSTRRERELQRKQKFKPPSSALMMLNKLLGLE